MIKITFPFSNCSFVIDAPVIIESHIFEKFFLFAELIKATDDITQCVVIHVDEYDINIHDNKTGKIHIIRSISHYDVFKKIINLIRENTVMHGDVCVLHASFIKMFGNGILLLGESGAGKSTLSAYLHLMEGCECYTDDIAFMNYDANVIQGVSQFINLRPSSLKLLPTNCKAFYDDFIERYKIMLNNRAEGTVDHIVLLNRQSNSEVAIKSIDNPIKVLAQNMYLPYSLKSNIVAANRLAVHVNVYEMCFSELFSAYSLLREMGG